MKEGKVKVDQEWAIASVYIEGYGRSRIARKCTQTKYNNGMDVIHYRDDVVEDDSKFAV